MEQLRGDRLDRRAYTVRTSLLRGDRGEEVRLVAIGLTLGLALIALVASSLVFPRAQ